MQIARTAADGLDPTDLSIDERLAVEARSDVEAFGPLYQRHVDSVFGYLRARGIGIDEAEELTALTFERALRNIGSFRPGGPGFRPWVLRIARNASIDAGRRRHRDPLDITDVPPIADSGPAPDEAAIAAEERRWIRGLVARLADVERDALALRYAVGLSSREIGLVIGKSEAATKKLLTRSLTRLKEAARHDD